MALNSWLNLLYLFAAFLSIEALKEKFLSTENLSHFLFIINTSKSKCVSLVGRYCGSAVRLIKIQIIFSRSHISFKKLALLIR